MAARRKNPAIHPEFSLPGQLRHGFGAAPLPPDRRFITPQEMASVAAGLGGFPERIVGRGLHQKLMPATDLPERIAEVKRLLPVTNENRHILEEELRFYEALARKVGIKL